MVFSSLVFVFVFFVMHLLVYFCFARTMQQKNIVLLVFSLIFYTWGGPKYLLLLAGMTGICWASALAIERVQENASKKKKVLIVCCVLMLSLLGIFKYTGFFLGSLQAVFGVPKAIPKIVLPIGISFYTFQLLSYVVDVYRGEVHAQKKYWMLLLYASLFHQCIAGPIIRYKDINRELMRRKINLSGLSQGITRFCVGLAKKAVLANGCAEVADTLLPSGAQAIMQAPAAALWLGMLFYMLQIYLDFSAYSDMAIGMGQMVGLHYKENFNYPYTAISVTDFWRRWHISLSSFFRDYVYIPLGGNRKGEPRRIVNLFVVWFLTGMWHGASWNYVLWGLYFFVFLVIEKYALQKLLDKIPKCISHLYLVVVVYFGWILFRFESLSEIGAMFKGMFCRNGNAAGSMLTGVQFKNEMFFLTVAIIAVTPFAKKLGRTFRDLCLRRFTLLQLYYIVETVIPPMLLVLSLMSLVGDSYNPFIYFQF